MNPGERNPLVESGAEQRRNQAITQLALDLFSQFNPSPTDQQRTHLQLFEQWSILSGSLAAQQERFSSEGKDVRDRPVKREMYPGIWNILRIAWHYKNNSALQVPTRAIILGKEENPEALIKPHEKVLVYINKERGRPDEDAIVFTGRKRIRTRMRHQEIELERPDVFLDNFDGDNHKSSFRIEGPDNLLVGGEIALGRFLSTIELSCLGDLTILSEAEVVSGGNSGVISLHAGGDLIQQSNTHIEPQEITALSFIRHPESRVSHRSWLDRAKINCPVVSDVSLPPLDPREFDIRDGNLERQVELVERIERGLLAVDLPEDLGGSSEDVKIKDKVDLEQAFDTAYPPHKEEQVEIPDGVRIFRGYNVSPATVTDFMVSALAAGWRVNFAEQVGKFESVVLTRDKPLD